MKRLTNPLFIFFLTLLARLLYLWYMPLPPLQFLPYQTDLRALRLLNGQTINYPDAWASFYIVVAGYYRLFDWLGLTDRLLWMALTQSALAALAAALLYLLALKLFERETLALVIAVVFALYYPFLYFNLMVLSETTFTVAVIGALYLLVARKRSALTMVGAGLLLGVALVSRPILTTFMPLLLIWLVATGQKWQRLWQPAALLAAFAAVLVGASAVNARVDTHGRFSYNGNTGVNFTLAQCRIKRIEYRLADGESFWFSPPMFWDTDLPEVYTDVPFYDNGYYMRMGLDCLKAEPIKLLTNLRHVANIYHSEFYPDFGEGVLHRLAIDVWKIPALALTVAFFAYPFVDPGARRAARPERSVRVTPREEDTSSPLRRTVRRALALRDYWLFAGLLVSLYASVYIASPGEERYLVSYYYLLLLYGLPTLAYGLSRVRLEQPDARPQSDRPL